MYSSIPNTEWDSVFGLENFYRKFQDFPYFCRICTNPDKKVQVSHTLDRV